MERAKPASCPQLGESGADIAKNDPFAQRAKFPFDWASEGQRPRVPG